MARHTPEGGLTWYRGSIRPYSSLWHTLTRLGSLNRLDLSQLPGWPVNREGRSTHHNAWYPLFNESHKLDINQISFALGEPPSSMRWSHLGDVAPWIQSYFTNHLRFCQTCLSQGYHSSFYSLKLLDSCPIHEEQFITGCKCGKVIEKKLSSTDFRQYARCKCGMTIFIDPKNCRIPTITVEQTHALDNIAAWLEELISLIKPVDHKASRYFDVVVPIPIDVATWCDVFEIRYPENLIKYASQNHSFNISNGGPFHDATPKPKSGFSQRLDKYWWEDSPATWTYRSICRHLRRHGSIEDPRIGRKYSTPHVYYEEFKRLYQDPKFAAAYTEFEWARHLERNARVRRWPFRDPWADPNQKFIGQLEIFGEPDWLNHPNIAKSTRTWIEYHWAAYGMLCLWTYYKNRTDRIVSGGNRWLWGEGTALPGWNWAAKVQPDGSVLFACLDTSTSLLPTRRHKSKSARIYEQKSQELQRAMSIRDICKGPCLTWNHRDGWNVTTAIAPGKLGCKRHTLLGSFKERPKFWLYPANGGYIARLEIIALQVVEQSPREAISLLRNAYTQYLKTFPKEGQHTMQTLPW